MPAEIDRSFQNPYRSSHQKPFLPEYNSVQRPHDECVLDALMSQFNEDNGILKLLKISNAQINNAANIAEKIAEPEFGTAASVVRYIAAIEYVNQASRRILGFEISDSLKAVSDFYEENKHIISRQFFDLLAYVEAAESMRKGHINEIVKRAMGCNGGNSCMMKDISPAPAESRGYSINASSINLN